MPEDLVLTRILGLVNSLLEPGVGGIGPEDPLSASGLDSLAMVQLLALIEDGFSVTLPPGEITPANFASAAALTALVKRLGRP
jgi:acyl carrier protein